MSCEKSWRIGHPFWPPPKIYFKGVPAGSFCTKCVPDVYILREHQQILIAFDKKCTEYNMCRCFCFVYQLKMLPNKNSSCINIKTLECKKTAQKLFMSNFGMGSKRVSNSSTFLTRRPFWPPPKIYFKSVPVGSFWTKCVPDVYILRELQQNFNGFW